MFFTPFLRSFITPFLPGPPSMFFTPFLSSFITPFVPGPSYSIPSFFSARIHSFLVFITKFIHPDPYLIPIPFFCSLLNSYFFLGFHTIFLHHVPNSFPSSRSLLYYIFFVFLLHSFLNVP